MGSLSGTLGKQPGEDGRMQKRQMFDLELSLHRGVRQKSRLEFLAER